MHKSIQINILTILIFIYTGALMRKTQGRKHTNSQTKSWRTWALNLHQWSKVYTKQWKVFKKKAISLSQLRMKSPFAFSLSPLGLWARPISWHGPKFRTCVVYVDVTFFFSFSFLFSRKTIIKKICLIPFYLLISSVDALMGSCLFIYIFLIMMNKGSSRENGSRILNFFWIVIRDAHFV